MLTLKDYAQYLPYGVEVLNKSGTCSFAIKSYKLTFIVEGQYKPILYPLSMVADIHGELMPKINVNYEVKQCIINFATGLIPLQKIPYAAYEALISNHIWPGDQSYFEKGLIINKSKV